MPVMVYTIVTHDTVTHAACTTKLFEFDFALISFYSLRLVLTAHLQIALKHPNQYNLNAKHISRGLKVINEFNCIIEKVLLTFFHSSALFFNSSAENCHYLLYRSAVLGRFNGINRKTRVKNTWIMINESLRSRPIDEIILEINGKPELMIIMQWESFTFILFCPHRQSQQFIWTNIHTRRH